VLATALAEHSMGGCRRHSTLSAPEQSGRWRVARVVFPADEPAPDGSRNRAGRGRDQYSKIVQSLSFCPNCIFLN
jgi:hypothetical protein